MLTALAPASRNSTASSAVAMPPIPIIGSLTALRGEESKGEHLAALLAETVRLYEKGEALQPIRIIGPAPATIGRINDIFRFVFYVKSAKYDRLVEVKDMLEQKVQGLQLKMEMVQFDFDPMNTM